MPAPPHGPVSLFHLGSASVDEDEDGLHGVGCEDLSVASAGHNIQTELTWMALPLI